TRWTLGVHALCLTAHLSSLCLPQSFTFFVVSISRQPTSTLFPYTTLFRSLHALTIGGVTFWFTLQNLGSALLGSVFGLLVALAIEFPAAFAKTARKFLVSQQGHLSSPGAKS